MLTLGKKPRPCRPGLAVVLTLLALGVAVAAPTRDQMAYWYQHYERAASDDPCVKKARTIFDRVVQAAGTSPVRVPALAITQKNPASGPLAIALPSRAIVLSQEVLARLLGRCTQAAIQGETRLAFILGHELAHHLRGDFWHLRFIAAFEPGDTPPILRKIGEDRRLQELRADVYSIIYAAMAGFNTHAVVADDPTVNFFQEWVRARSDTHPTPQQRADAVKGRLQQVMREVDVFHLGLQFYHAGQYQLAIDAFDAFRLVFESREVFHNLAVSHHQLALQAHRLWKKMPDVIPFHLSLAIDPETRARQIRLRKMMSRSADGPAARVHQHLDHAITFYSAAIERDPTYGLSSTNLGAALIIRRIVDDNPADLHAAVERLLRVPVAARSPATLNNLGVAHWYLGEPKKASNAWHEARQRDAAYALAVFNLGEQAYRTRRMQDAQQYWR